MADANTDRLRGDLKNAMERLNRSQVALGDALAHRQMLQEAIDRIRQVAVYHCPEWSKYDDPPIEPLATSKQEGPDDA